MFPILYENITTGVVPDNFGIGVLKDALSCEVTEERNGEYELKLKYPSSGAYVNQLVPRAIIKAKPNYTDDPQLFRIYKVGKVINSSFTIYARHISYDLSGFPITTGTANNVSDALTLLQNASPGYVFNTDKSTHANFTIHTPSSVRSWLGGKDGSILDVYGPGEYKYNNFTVSFLANRGQDRGVTVRYGKNLTKLENTDDSSNLVTGIMAYWQSTDDDKVTITSDVITTGVTLDVVAVNVIDASGDFENQPTKSQLNTYVNKYIQNHEVQNVKKNFKFDFVQVSRLLKDRVDLCDTIHIIYEDYNIQATAKCIATTWDVLNDKYKEVEIGEPKTNIADTISSINKAVSGQITGNQVKQAINSATELITGNRGGYVILHDSDGDTYPDELLIMNTPDIATATKVWRWNLSGLGYSSNGYSGPFGLAMTMDGAIVADYVKTGNLVFGGGGNTNGKLEIRDASGNIICRFDKTGADVKGHIQAESFTADAGNNYSVDILTTTEKVSMLGKLSGALLYNGNKAISGFAYNQGSNAPVLFVAEPSSTNTGSTIGMIRQNKFSSGLSNIETYNRWVNGDAYDDYCSVQMLAGKSNNTTRQVQHNANIANPNNSSYSGNAYAGFGVTETNNAARTGSMSVSLGGGQSVSGSVSNNNAGFSSQLDNDNYAQLGVTKSNNNTNAYLNLKSSSGPAIYAYASSNSHGISLSNGGTSSIYLNGSNGNVVCVSVTQTSSEKYKKNIEDLTEEEAKKILELRPVDYDFINESQGTNMHGFIAEEVDKVIPDLVKHTSKYPDNIVDEDGNIIEQEDEVSLDYIMMIPYITKMLQMQQKQIDLQQKQIENLTNELNKLKGDLNNNGTEH